MLIQLIFVSKRSPDSNRKVKSTKIISWQFRALRAFYQESEPLLSLYKQAIIGSWQRAYLCLWLFGWSQIKTLIKIFGGI